MNTYLIPYFDYSNHTNEIIKVEANNDEEAIMIMLKSKGWEINDWKDVSTISDVCFGNPYKL